MKIKRLKKGVMTVLIFMLICMTSSVMAYNKDDIDHSTDDIENAPVVVAQTITGDVPEGGGVFTYQITAITEDAPMPKDGDTLTLTGDDYGYFRFDFSGFRAGDLFEYEIRQEKNTDENYSWDETVYHVYFQILRGKEGDLEVNLVISNDDVKDPIAEFTNTYTTPGVDIPVNPEGPVISTQPNTYTGIMGQKGALVLVGILMLTAAGTIIASKKKSQK